MVVHPASKPAPQDEVVILDIPAKRNLARAIGKSVSSPHKLPVAVPNGIDDRAIEASSG